jgi:hypothetical protein
MHVGGGGGGAWVCVRQGTSYSPMCPMRTLALNWAVVGWPGLASLRGGLACACHEGAHLVLLARSQAQKYSPMLISYVSRGTRSRHGACCGIGQDRIIVPWSLISAAIPPESSIVCRTSRIWEVTNHCPLSLSSRGLRQGVHEAFNQSIQRYQSCPTKCGHYLRWCALFALCNVRLPVRAVRRK